MSKMKELKSKIEKLECEELRDMLAYVNFEFVKMKKELEVLKKRIDVIETETIP